MNVVLSRVRLTPLSHHCPLHTDTEPGHPPNCSGTSQSTVCHNFPSSDWFLNESLFCVSSRETWPSHLNPAKIHVTGSHVKKTSRVFPFRHQLNGVSINVFSSSAPRRGRLSFFFSSPRKWPPDFPRPWTVTGLMITQVQSHRSASPRRGNTNPLII